MKLDVKNQYWMGEIPDSWETKKIKFVLSQRNENNVPIKSTEILSLTAKQGVIPYSEKEGGGNKPKQDFSAYKLTYPGDIVMNSMNILSGAVGLSKYMGCISPVYYALKPKNKTDDVRFFYYVFANKTFQNSLLGLGNGILIKQSDNGNFNTIRMRIPIEKLNSLSVPYPSPSIQQQIADFLDHKTAEIDGLIDKINTEIDTLKQYQSSVITQAVTKGLDPNVPMKDSGIEWIGEIPETWKVVKIKHLVNTVNLKDKLSNLNSRYIGLENVEKGTGKLIMTATTYPDEIYKICKKGNVLYSKLRPNLAKVLIAPFDSCCTSEFEVLNTFNNRWIKYCLLSNGITEMTTAATYGVKMPRVNWEEVSNYKIPVPKNDEIEIINNYIDSKMLTVDNLIKQKQQQITELTEYKNSLIFEYVTGKKQVKEAN